MIAFSKRRIIFIIIVLAICWMTFNITFCSINSRASRVHVSFDSDDVEIKSTVSSINIVEDDINKVLIKIDGNTKELAKGEEYTIRVTGDFEDKSGSKIQQYINKLKNLLNVNNFSNFFGGAASSIFKKLGIKGLAKGGIVTQPTRALIGEAGYPEAVVPMTQDYLSTLASEIGKYSSGGKNQVVNIYLDGRLIQRQMQSVEDNKNFATNK